MNLQETRELEVRKANILSQGTVADVMVDGNHVAMRIFGFGQDHSDIMRNVPTKRLTESQFMGEI